MKDPDLISRDLNPLGLLACAIMDLEGNKYAKHIQAQKYGHGQGTNGDKKPGD